MTQSAAPSRETLLRKMIRNRGLMCLYLSLAFFVIALATPAIETESIDRQTLGLGNWSFGASLLVVGWLGILCGQFGWFANVPLAIGWLTLAGNFRVPAAICGALALLLSLLTLQLFHSPIPGGYSVNGSLLRQLGPGFYFWHSSMLLVLIGAIIGKSPTR